MKSILISGGDGSFAKALKKVNQKFKLYTPNKKNLDVTSYSSIEKYLKNKKINYFIHAAALTNPMIQHREKVEKSILTNIIGSSNVALCCYKKKIKLIYISTNFVYEGRIGNYSEKDALLPVNEYGWSKLGGECPAHIYKNSLILRICMNDDIFPHKVAYSNYLTSFIKKTDAAIITLKLLDQKGIINVGGKSQSAYNFAKKLNNKVKKNKVNLKKKKLLGKNTSININKLKMILKNEKN